MVDYRDDQCVASRQYGAPDNPIALGIRPAPNGETYELMVSRKRSGPDFAVEQEGSVDFGGGRIKAWLLNYGGTQTKADVYQFRISAPEMEQARFAKTVTLRAARALDVSFELRSMSALLTGLQDCTADLKSYWNMGGEQDGRIATSAMGDVRALFTSDDYPVQALKNDQQGQSRFLLLIDDKGSVAGCHVLQASGVPVLDAMGCQVIRQRAKFTPARDSRGAAVRSTYTTPLINWSFH
ncbi:MAG: energy transducer TonB [Sphingomicrobium sp.]